MASYRSTLREELIQALSDEEIVVLVGAMRSSFCKSRAKGVDYLRTISAKNLFGFLCFKILGHWCYEENHARRVVESMNKVKAFIHEFQVGQVPEAKIERPKMPVMFCVTNPVAGKVPVTIHAWERFIERAHRMDGEPLEIVVNALTHSFALARPTVLERGYGAIRIMSNRFESSEYYLDAFRKLRFVVVIKKGLKVLSTVENPY